jgi:hypothetical protein
MHRSVERYSKRLGQIARERQLGKQVRESAVAYNPRARRHVYENGSILVEVAADHALLSPIPKK